MPYIYAMLSFNSDVFSKLFIYQAPPLTYRLLSFSNLKISQNVNISNRSGLTDLNAVFANSDCFGSIGIKIFDTSLGDSCKKFISFFLRRNFKII